MKSLKLIPALVLSVLGLAHNASADRYDLRPYPGSYGYSQDVTVHCKSTDYRYNTCNVNGYVTNVVLVNRDSHSACNYGSDYGATTNGVWVNNGCEGDFRVTVQQGGGGYYPPPPGGGGYYPPPPGGGGYYPPPPGGGYGQTYTVTCESTSYDYRHCDAGLRVSYARITRQLSNTSCNQGSNWGYDATGVWVNNGCRAVFEVTGY